MVTETDLVEVMDYWTSALGTPAYIREALQDNPRRLVILQWLNKHEVF